MTDSEFATAIQMLKTAYPYFRIPDETVLLYRKHWSWCPGPVLIACVERWVASESKFPTIADISRLANATPLPGQYRASGAMTEEEENAYAESRGGWASKEEIRECMDGIMAMLSRKWEG